MRAQSARRDRTQRIVRRPRLLLLEPAGIHSGPQSQRAHRRSRAPLSGRTLRRDTASRNSLRSLGYEPKGMSSSAIRRIERRITNWSAMRSAPRTSPRSMARRSVLRGMRSIAAAPSSVVVLWYRRRWGSWSHDRGTRNAVWPYAFGRGLKGLCRGLLRHRLARSLAIRLPLSLQSRASQSNKKSRTRYFNSDGA